MNLRFMSTIKQPCLDLKLFSLIIFLLSLSINAIADDSKKDAINKYFDDATVNHRQHLQDLKDEFGRQCVPKQEKFFTLECMFIDTGYASQVSSQCPPSYRRSADIKSINENSLQLSDRVLAVDSLAARALNQRTEMSVAAIGKIIGQEVPAPLAVKEVGINAESFKDRVTQTQSDVESYWYEHDFVVKGPLTDLGNGRFRANSDGQGQVLSQGDQVQTIQTKHPLTYIGNDDKKSKGTEIINKYDLNGTLKISANVNIWRTQSVHFYHNRTELYPGAVYHEPISHERLGVEVTLVNGDQKKRVRNFSTPILLERLGPVNNGSETIQWKVSLLEHSDLPQSQRELIFFSSPLEAISLEVVGARQMTAGFKRVWELFRGSQYQVILHINGTPNEVKNAVQYKTQWDFSGTSVHQMEFTDISALQKGEDGGTYATAVLKVGDNAYTLGDKPQIRAVVDATAESVFGAQSRQIPSIDATAPIVVKSQPVAELEIQARFAGSEYRKVAANGYTITRVKPSPLARFVQVGSGSIDLRVGAKNIKGDDYHNAVRYGDWQIYASKAGGWNGLQSSTKSLLLHLGTGLLPGFINIGIGQPVLRNGIEFHPDGAKVYPLDPIPLRLQVISLEAINRGSHLKLYLMGVAKNQTITSVWPAANGTKLYLPMEDQDQINGFNVKSVIVEKSQIASRGKIEVLNPLEQSIGGYILRGEDENPGVQLVEVSNPRGPQPWFPPGRQPGNLFPPGGGFGLPPAPMPDPLPIPSLFPTPVPGSVANKPIPTLPVQEPNEPEEDDSNTPSPVPVPMPPMPIMAACNPNNITGLTAPALFVANDGSECRLVTQSGLNQLPGFSELIAVNMNVDPTLVTVEFLSLQEFTHDGDPPGSFTEADFVDGNAFSNSFTHSSGTFRVVVSFMAFNSTATMDIRITNASIMVIPL